MATRIPLVAIVGKPNVGKSTLFNRIIGERRAVVEDVPGVTRDRNYAHCEAYDIPFGLVDTGGFGDKQNADEMQVLVKEQSMLAVEEADVVLALFDGNSGVHAADEEVVEVLRRSGKPVVFAVNKCDGKEQVGKITDFYVMGLDTILDVSALHGHGVSSVVGHVLAKIPDFEAIKSAHESEIAEIEDRVREALEELAENPDAEEALNEPEEAEAPAEEQPAVVPVFAPVYLPEEVGGGELSYDRQNRIAPLPDRKTLDQPELIKEIEVDTEIECISVAIVGKPNAGKSTLLNAITGTDRAITSPVAGTTRDTVNLNIEIDDQQYLLIDTAGLRKKARVSAQVERYSTIRALNALSESDVAVLVLDATEGPSEQDTKIAGLAHEQGRGLVIVVNKWDLVEKDHMSVKEFTEEIRVALKFAPYAPIVFTSALSGRRCNRVIEEAKKVAYSRARRIPTGRLNEVIKQALKRRSLPVYRGRPVKIYYASQVATAPPRFCIFVNYPRGIHFSNMRFLKNSIRDAFGFMGSDIKLTTRKRESIAIR